MGEVVGEAVGVRVGLAVGLYDGEVVGEGVGEVEGVNVGLLVGAAVILHSCHSLQVGLFTFLHTRSKHPAVHCTHKQSVMLYKGNHTPGCCLFRTSIKQSRACSREEKVSKSAPES